MIDIELLHNDISILRNRSCKNLSFKNDNEDTKNLLLHLNDLFTNRLRHPDCGYWPPAKLVSPKYVVELVKKNIRDRNIEKMKGHTWLHIILNEGLLEMVFLGFNQNLRALQPYYYSDSVFFSSKRQNKLLSIEYADLAAGRLLHYLLVKRFQAKRLQDIARELESISFSLTWNDSSICDFYKLCTSRGKSATMHSIEASCSDRGSVVTFQFPSISKQSRNISKSVVNFLKQSLSESNSTDEVAMNVLPRIVNSDSPKIEINLIDFDTEVISSCGNETMEGGSPPVDPWNGLFVCSSPKPAPLTRHEIDVAVVDAPIKVLRKSVKSTATTYADSANIKQSSSHDTDLPGSSTDLPETLDDTYQSLKDQWTSSTNCALEKSNMAAICQNVLVTCTSSTEVVSRDDLQRHSSNNLDSNSTICDQFALQSNAKVISCQSYFPTHCFAVTKYTNEVVTTDQLLLRSIASTNSDVGRYNIATSSHFMTSLSPTVNHVFQPLVSQVPNESSVYFYQSIQCSTRVIDVPTHSLHHQLGITDLNILPVASINAGYKQAIGGHITTTQIHVDTALSALLPQQDRTSSRCQLPSTFAAKEIPSFSQSATSVTNLKFSHPSRSCIPTPKLDAPLDSNHLVTSYSPLCNSLSFEQSVPQVCSVSPSAGGLLNVLCTENPVLLVNSECCSAPVHSSCVSPACIVTSQCSTLQRRLLTSESGSSLLEIRSPNQTSSVQCKISLVDQGLSTESNTTRDHDSFSNEVFCIEGESSINTCFQSVCIEQSSDLIPSRSVPLHKAPLPHYEGLSSRCGLFGVIPTNDELVSLHKHASLPHSERSLHYESFDIPPPSSETPSSHCEPVDVPPPHCETLDVPPHHSERSPPHYQSPPYSKMSSSHCESLDVPPPHSERSHCQLSDAPSSRDDTVVDVVTSLKLHSKSINNDANSPVVRRSPSSTSSLAKQSTGSASSSQRTHFALQLMLYVLHSDREKIHQVVEIPFEGSTLVFTDSFLYIVTMVDGRPVAHHSFKSSALRVYKLYNDQVVMFSTGLDHKLICYTADPHLTHHVLDTAQEFYGPCQDGSINKQQEIRDLISKRTGFVCDVITAHFVVKCHWKQAAHHSGFLSYRVGRLVRKWCPSYYVVDAGILYKYTNSDDVKPISSYVLSSSCNVTRKNFDITIFLARDDVMHLRARTNSDAVGWLEAILWNMLNPTNQHLCCSLVVASHRLMIVTTRIISVLSLDNLDHVDRIGDCDVSVRSTNENASWLLTFAFRDSCDRFLSCLSNSALL